MGMFLIITLCLLGLAAPLPAAEKIPDSVGILDNGTIVLPNNGEVPPYSRSGNWTEMEKKESDRYLIRHFLFMVPNKPPAFELYVKHDRADEPPDGVFEIGLVRGYVSGFASKAGFTFGGLFFDDLVIGSANVKRCLVPLSKDKRKIWVYAYTFPRKLSLTFITVRAESDARDSIENYLATLRLR